MSRVATFDFTGAPPAQGGGADHIPPGRYVMRLTKIADDKDKNQKRMVVASLEVVQGEETGKRLRENFPIGVESKFPRQRLNAFFQALGLAVGEKIVKIDLDKLEGKLVEADVRDQIIAATENYPERTGSKVDGFFLVGSKTAMPTVSASTNGATATATAVRPAAAVPAEAPALPFEEPIEELTADDNDAALAEQVEATDALLN